MAKIFITGGAGFIGSHLIQSLLPLGHEITVFDNLHPQIHGINPAKPEWMDRVTFFKESVEDKAALMRAFSADTDVVYHLAAETGTGQSMYEMSRYCNTNVTGTSNLLEVIREKGSKVSKVILPSSRAIYGEGEWVDAKNQRHLAQPRSSDKMSQREYKPWSSDTPLLQPCANIESQRPNPSSVYASTKLMQEFLVEHACTSSNWNAVMLRFQNVYGAGQSLKNPYTGVLSIFTAELMKGNKLNIYEDGNIIRDFIYVSDVVSALVKSLDYSAQKIGIFNIGSGQATTILETAKTLMAILKVPSDSYQVTGHFRNGDIRSAYADITKAQSELGWKPEHSVEDGLKKLVNWAVPN